MCVCFSSVPLLGRYVGLAEEKQDLYQRELMQHGRTMEELSLVKDKNRRIEEELQEARQEISTMKEEVNTTQVSALLFRVSARSVTEEPGR